MDDELKRADELYWKGELYQADRFYECLYEKFRKEGDEKQAAFASRRRGIISSDRGDSDKALAYYNISLELTRKIGDKVGEGSTLGNMVCIYRQKGNNERALECVEESRKIHEGLGSEKELAQDYCLKAKILADLGRISESYEWMNKSVDIAEKTNDKPSMAGAYSDRGRLYKLAGVLEEAKKDFEKAKEVAKGIEAEWKEQFIKQIEEEEKDIKKLGGE